MVYYIHHTDWLDGCSIPKKEMKEERAVYPARFISFIYSLSFARRIQTPAHRSVQGKSRSHGLLFSFAKQGSVPCSILRIPFFPNIIPEIKVNFWRQTTCHFIGISGFRVDVPVWFIIQLIGVVCNVKYRHNYHFHDCYDNKDFVIFYFMCKLVDCLEKCLIYRHIRRFAD